MGALRDPFDFAQGRPLKRRSSTVVHTVLALPIKIKNKVKGSGQECPLHTCSVPHGRLPFLVLAA